MPLLDSVSVEVLFWLCPPLFSLLLTGNDFLPGGDPLGTSVVADFLAKDGDAPPGFDRDG